MKNVPVMFDHLMHRILQIACKNIILQKTLTVSKMLLLLLIIQYPMQNFSYSQSSFLYVCE